jgi:hypothetical protein
MDKIPKFVRLLLAPVLFWVGLLGFVLKVVGERKKRGLLIASDNIREVCRDIDSSEATRSKDTNNPKMHTIIRGFQQIHPHTSPKRNVKRLPRREPTHDRKLT